MGVGAGAYKRYKKSFQNNALMRNIKLRLTKRIMKVLFPFDGLQFNDTINRKYI